MSSVILDITEGTIRRDSDGWHATRVARVEMDAGGSSASLPYRATQVPGLPRYGDPHPAVPGIRVKAIDVQHDEAREPLLYSISYEYGGNSLAAGALSGALQAAGIKGVEVSTSTVQYQTLRDHKGDIMSYVYVGPERLYNFVGVGATEVRFVSTVNAEEATIDIPTAIVTVTTERDNASFARSRDVAGIVNASPWSGLPAKSWLSLGVDSALNQDGRYDWQHIFAIAPKVPGNPTWQFRSERIRNSNYLRFDTTVGNGVAFFDVYEPRNFTAEFGFELS